MLAPLLALAVATVLAVTGFVFLPAPSIPNNEGGPLRCELRAISGPGGVELSAIASSSVATSGNYRLVVAKSGAVGGSDIDQSGGFSVTPGTQSTLSVVSMGLERGASYVAKLTVTWKGGTVTCSRVFPSPL